MSERDHRDERIAHLAAWKDAVQSAEHELERIAGSVGEVNYDAPLPTAVMTLISMAMHGVAARIDRAHAHGWLEWHYLENRFGERGLAAVVGTMQFHVTDETALLDVIDADHALAEATHPVAA